MIKFIGGFIIGTLGFMAACLVGGAIGCLLFLIGIVGWTVLKLSAAVRGPYTHHSEFEEIRQMEAAARRERLWTR